LIVIVSIIIPFKCSYGDEDNKSLQGSLSKKQCRELLMNARNIRLSFLMKNDTKYIGRISAVDSLCQFITVNDAKGKAVVIEISNIKKISTVKSLNHTADVILSGITIFSTSFLVVVLILLGLGQNVS